LKYWQSTRRVFDWSPNLRQLDGSRRRIDKIKIATRQYENKTDAIDYTYVTDLSNRLGSLSSKSANLERFGVGQFNRKVRNFQFWPNWNMETKHLFFLILV
jgi:hypothetical protein